MRKHRNEDLHIDRTGGSPQQKCLTGKVRHPLEPRLIVEAHLRPGFRTAQPPVQQCAEPAVAVGLAALEPDLVAEGPPELPPAAGSPV